MIPSTCVQGRLNNKNQLITSCNIRMWKNSSWVVLRAQLIAGKQQRPGPPPATGHPAWAPTPAAKERPHNHLTLHNFVRAGATNSSTSWLVAGTTWRPDMPCTGRRITCLCPVAGSPTPTGAVRFLNPKHFMERLHFTYHRSCLILIYAAFI